jgi:hypothetical protein
LVRTIDDLSDCAKNKKNRKTFKKKEHFTTHGQFPELNKKLKLRKTPENSSEFLETFKNS